MQQININELKPHPRNNEFFDDMTGVEFLRFISSKTNSVQFKTLSTNANNMFTYVSLYGNKFGTGENGFALLEENAAIINFLSSLQKMSVSSCKFTKKYQKLTQKSIILHEK